MGFGRFEENDEMINRNNQGVENKNKWKVLIRIIRFFPRSNSTEGANV